MTPTDNRQSSAAPHSTRVPLIGRGRRAAIGALTALAVACTADGAAGPRTLATPARDLQLGSIASVWTVQLRTLPPNPIQPSDPYYGYGHLQLRAGSVIGDACLPPSPITPQPGSTVVSVCGRIFNEGGAVYRGGGIYTVADLFGDGVVVAEFHSVFPNDPCRRYDIAGAVLVPDVLATDMIANPTHYEVRMFGDVAGTTTRIGGLLDGSAWGPVGRAETDPFFAAKICPIAVTP